MNTEQFLQILNEHRWVLYKVINAYCKDPEDRKDLEQEILIQLWKSADSYDHQARLSTWIYRIAMNVSISFYRSDLSRKSRTSPISESFIQVARQPEGTPFADERKFLQDLLDQLDPFNREILILYLDGRSYREIADIVGITESNVGTKLNRIKNKLQELYSKLNTISHGTR